MPTSSPRKVFCSHRSVDKPKVEAAAAELRRRGIDAWLDKWEILGGDDVVAKINQGLAEADAILVFFSKETENGKWVFAEISAALTAMIEDNLPVIPILLEDGVPLPPLLRPRCRLGIDQIDQIVDAIENRSTKPPLGKPGALAPAHELLLHLDRANDHQLHVTARLDGRLIAENHPTPIGAAFAFSYHDFLKSPALGHAVRAAANATATIHARETELHRLGEALGQALFPAPVAAELAALLAAPHRDLHVIFETGAPDLLAIPFEAARLASGQCLALELGVRLSRRLRAADPTHQTLAAPLRILVALGAPDEGLTRNSVLDGERELETILDAIEPAQRHGNAYARILSVGHPDQIAAELERQSYHVLHLSGHGGQGVLELEDEDGGPVPTDAARLAQVIRGRVPLVMLAACHSGVGDSETASLAQALIARGVPAVVAMQSSVGDAYATSLAGHFYQRLAEREAPLVSEALAHARRRQEEERRQLPPAEQQLPEYATPALFTATREIPLLDRSLPKAAWQEPAAPRDAGQVPMLGLGDLVGRRAELRRVYRLLTDHPASLDAFGQRQGAQITGMGGVGKSALAGRLITRLSEEGWLAVAPRTSHWSLAEMLEALQAVAPQVDNPALQRALAVEPEDDRARLALLRSLLKDHRILLVLDNFEDNLTLGGEAFKDVVVASQFAEVVSSASRGRLLVTCRYPVPGAEDALGREELGALTDAQTRKLLWRHSTLRALPPEEFRLVLRAIGGHPRMLEYLHALLNNGVARLPHVRARLRENAASAGVDLRRKRSLEEALADARAIGTADILLEELLAWLAEAVPVLRQVAVFPRPVSAEVLARCGVADLAALGRLVDGSLVTRGEGTWWVHRWTAEALKQRDEVAWRACCAAAGRALETPTSPVEDDVDAVRLFLEADEYDDAARVGQNVVGHLQYRARASYVAALAGEVARGLERGTHHFAYRFIATEADALLKLGFREEGSARHEQVLQHCEQLVRQEPGRADYLRDLSVSYERMGDLMRALVQGDAALSFFQKALDLREQLVGQEPARADYLRDLSVSYSQMGDLMRALGQGDAARSYFQKDLDIAEQLVRQEPGRADYLGDLSVSYNKMGDLMRDLGQGDAARLFFQKALDLREQLVRQEPGRADYLRDLSVSLERMGDVTLDLRQGDAGRSFFQRALQIREQLVRQEPGRVDYLRDLSFAYNKMGHLMRALGQDAAAHPFVQKALDLREQLVRQEPSRSDYLRDLSVSYNRMGDLKLASRQEDAARALYQKALDIAEQLVRQEPGRSDYLRDLSVSNHKMGELMLSLGRGDASRSFFQKALDLRDQLVRQEPSRADHQIDLVASLSCLGDRASLIRALDIVKRLEAEGRLTSQQAGWRQELEKMLGSSDAP